MAGSWPGLVMQLATLGSGERTNTQTSDMSHGLCGPGGT